MTLADRIRAALAPAHDAVERTQFAAAMAAGTIGRREYVVGLGQLLHLHAGLEAALTDAPPELAALYDPARMRRTPLIARDLAALGAEPAASPVPAVAGVVDAFFRWAAESPWALAGPLYVVEGSRMGSMFLARSLANAFGVTTDPGAGLDYHADGLATRPKDWQHFRATLSGLDLSEAKRIEVIRAAGTTMDALVELYDGLPVGPTPP